MKTYVVTVQETVTRQWVVQADNEENAKDFYESGTVEFEKQDALEIYDAEERVIHDQ